MKTILEKSLTQQQIIVRDRTTVKTSDTPLQWHSYHELLLITAGKDVRIRFSEQTLTLNVGDFLLIPPGVLHELFCGPDGNARLYYAHFYGSELPLSQSASSFSALRQLTFSQEWLRIPCPAALIEELDAILQFCIRERQEKKPAHHLICQAMIMRALALVLEHQQQTKKESCPHSPDLILLDKVLHYVKKNQTQPLILPKVAAAIGYSPSHLSKRFHALTGRTFKEYVDYLKMQQALSHLLQGKSIAEISELLGYSSSQSFSRAFRRVMKQSPARLLKNADQ